jgi:hypothetical protein
MQNFIVIGNIPALHSCHVISHSTKKNLDNPENSLIAQQLWILVASVSQLT